MKGFKEFLMRGNLLELAVAVIMAGAFGAVVETFTNVILSLISMIAGGEPNFDNVMIGNLLVGPFITAIVNFIIVGAIVYFLIVKPMMMWKQRRGEVDQEAKSEADLLTEIRDLLAAQQGKNFDDGLGGPTVR